MSWVLSFLIGSVVGLLYGLLGIRSPAPPVIALLGLLGMLAGENAVPALKRAASSILAGPNADLATKDKDHRQ